MVWDGIERRQEPRFCPQHLPMSNTLVRIEERLIALDKRVTDTLERLDKRRGVVTTLAIGLISSIVFTIYAYGQLNKQVEINTAKWERLENGKVSTVR